ncbi:hypothetical protein HSX11_13500 [Oxalobacteraceae bacterium]|nr:hypothetical protein [Oxalobacteraceae bacterium]
MHNAICHCPKCRQRNAEGFEVMAFVIPRPSIKPLKRPVFAGSAGLLGRPVTGRWRRRGNRIVLMGNW